MKPMHRLISRIRYRFNLGPRRIAVFLNRHGIKTARGLEWTQNRVMAAMSYPVRRARITVARKNGTHTADEWRALVAVYGGICLRCGSPDVQRDHIIPVSTPGSSDALENLQPLCGPCNGYPNKHFSETDYRIGAKHLMTPDRIKAIRLAAGENTEDFGKRFARSGRTVEDWEQGRRNPDPLAISILVKIEVAQQKGAGKKARKSRSRAID